MSLLHLMILAMLPLGVTATTFRVQSIGDQVKESEGIIIGHFLKKRFIKLEDGSIATQMIFKMNKELGLQSELFGQDEVIVHYPGGSMGDEHVRIEGVPEFIPGEKIVLLTKTINSRYWGLNLGFGTFKVISFGRDILIINTLFPGDSRVSQMRLEEFEKTVKAIKGSNLKIVEVRQYPLPGETSQGRAPASISEGKNRAIASKIEEEENNSNGPNLSTFWLVVIFALLGGFFRFFRETKAK